MNLAKILPMAFVMIAGPQILSAIFLATSEDWRRNSIAYITGAALSITAIISASYFFINGAQDGGRVDDTIDIVILVLLVLAAIHTYRQARGVGAAEVDGQAPETPTPSSRSSSASCSSACSRRTSSPRSRWASTSANHDSPWWHCALFVALTLFLLAHSPALAARIRRARSGRHAEGPRLDEQQLVGRSEIVIGLFVVLTLDRSSLQALRLAEDAGLLGGQLLAGQDALLLELREALELFQAAGA